MDNKKYYFQWNISSIINDSLKFKKVFKFIDIYVKKYIYKHYFQSNTSIDVHLSLVLIFPHLSMEKEMK